IVLGFVLRALIAAGIPPSLTLSGGLFSYLVYAIWFLNLSLFAFHLLPIPGLDGWDVIETIFRPRNPRFFFNVSVRRREVVVGVVAVIIIGQFIGFPVLSVVMSPFYQPASLISLGRCAGYGVPGFNGLYPCLL
ncbi:MAG TPA: hypothetical protein VLR46_10010, partial [Candidatus Dormibacteraeota bacterium]|nr:hypothetical protein [Candidatus Dormibacteraeota bacterium]